MTDLRKAAEMALEVLEHLSKGESPAITKGELVYELAALRKALAQQDKECIAIVNEGMGGIEWLSPCLPDDTPLYAEPPKREWVGLTDKEVAKCIQIDDDCFIKPLATYRAIEAKLKEKNT